MTKIPIIPTGAVKKYVAILEKNVAIIENIYD